MSSNITYSAKIHSFTNYEEDINEIYGGTFTSSEPFTIDVRIWNNRYGTTKVASLKNFAVNISFEHYEDSALLNNITIIYNDTEEMNTYISENTLIATFIDTVEISGDINNGLDTDTDNYIDLLIKIETADGISLKNHDMKSMILEIVQQ